MASHAVVTALFAFPLLSCGQSAPPIDTRTQLLTVDQFGWLPEAQKVAIVAEPIKGQNSNISYKPGDSFEIRSQATNKTVYKGTLKPWNNGATSELAGDKVWFADFSALKTPGTYYLVDAKNAVRSYPFKVAKDVYSSVLVDSLRVFYYQRCGTAIDAKHGGNWTHVACHLTADRAAEETRKGKSIGSPINAVGGWHDAGDYSKYVPFLETTLFDLLYAYDRNPKAFGDANNIPESGNGVPDILDEVRWELNWLLKMQDTDGGFWTKLGGRSYDTGQDDPATDKQPRFRTAKTTWATASSVGAFAHAARTYSPFDKAFSAKLNIQAELGWKYLESHPSMDPSDGTDGDPSITSGSTNSNPNADRRSRVYAAAELFRLTGQTKFRDYVDKWSQDSSATNENGQHPLANHMVDPLSYLGLVQALFEYAQTPGASKPVVDKFKEALGNGAEMILQATGGQDDPYLAYHNPDHYCWGSNQSKGRWGRVLLMASDLNLHPEHRAQYREIAAGYVHFIHGRNPLGLCYLSNMEKRGASNSVQEVYHGWFRDGSKRYDGRTSQYGQAPGYLAGGPNKFFSVDWIRPPYGEPAMKAYKDWNASWNNERRANEASWEVTEPAIYYQASYTLLLSDSVGK